MDGSNKPACTLQPHVLLTGLSNLSGFAKSAQQKHPVLINRTLSSYHSRRRGIDHRTQATFPWTSKQHGCGIAPPPNPTPLSPCLPFACVQLRQRAILFLVDGCRFIAIDYRAASKGTSFAARLVLQFIILVDCMMGGWRVSCFLAGGVAVLH